MAKNKLTKSAVDAAQSQAQSIELRDTVVPGFPCKITPASRKVLTRLFRAPCCPLRDRVRLLRREARYRRHGDGERNWLDEYYRKVRETLVPHLTERARHWIGTAMGSHVREAGEKPFSCVCPRPKPTLRHDNATR